MFRHRRGEMFKWLQQSGRDMSDCGQESPVAGLQRAGILGPNLLAAHVNYLSRGDASLLGKSSVNVVHCPRSHLYFKHRRFPLQRLARAGVNICLGTDSLASVYRRRNDMVQLDMFAEMRALAQAQPKLSPRSILRMATANGARALGLAGHIGTLAKGALADIVALPMPSKGSNLYEAVVHHEGPVLASMIAGRWAIPPEEE
jgi:cytosine/adenosine deaminase-related metal-dependent hydrolase